MKRFLLTAVLVLVAIPAAAWGTKQLAASWAAPKSLSAAATQWADSLTAEQKTKGLLSYDSPQRTVWNFVPLETRRGLPIREMNSEQQALAMQLLQVAVSQVGYEAATQIMSLENVLRKLEGAGREEWRDPNKYYVTIYGKPAASGVWGFSFEGHHLSLNFVMDGDKVVDSTPQFMATNPAELKDSYGEKFPKGMRVLADEEIVAFDLLRSLTEEQMKKALIAKDALKEIRGPNTPQPPAEAAAGISAKELNDQQKEILKKLIDVYCNKMLESVSQDRMKRIQDAGWHNISFAWAGASQSGIGHYYRVQGPSFLIELVNTQPDAAGNIANHVHCVWRDMTGDFNLDVANK